MGIKLSDFIKDTYNVFTLEEAEQIYKDAGYIDSDELPSNEKSIETFD